MNWRVLRYTLIDREDTFIWPLKWQVSQWAIDARYSLLDSFLKWIWCLIARNKAFVLFYGMPKSFYYTTFYSYMIPFTSQIALHFFPNKDLWSVPVEDHWTLKSIWSLFLLVMAKGVSWPSFAIPGLMNALADQEAGSGTVICAKRGVRGLVRPLAGWNYISCL